MTHKVNVLESHIFPKDSFNHEESIYCPCCPSIDEYFMRAIIHNKIGNQVASRKNLPNGKINLSRNRLFGHSPSISIQSMLDANTTW